LAFLQQPVKARGFRECRLAGKIFGGVFGAIAYIQKPSGTVSGRVAMAAAPQSLND
jgi:hypothetical protein